MHCAFEGCGRWSVQCRERLCFDSAPLALSSSGFAVDWLRGAARSAAVGWSINREARQGVCACSTVEAVCAESPLHQGRRHRRLRAGPGMRRLLRSDPRAGGRAQQLPRRDSPKGLSSFRIWMGTHVEVFNAATWWRPHDLIGDARFRVLDPSYYCAVACREAEEGGLTHITESDIIAPCFEPLPSPYSQPHLPWLRRLRRATAMRPLPRRP